jgi:hypothetical protein
MIKTVTLQNIHVVELETLKRLLYCLEDVLGQRCQKKKICEMELSNLTTETMFVHVSALVKVR